MAIERPTNSSGVQNLRMPTAKSPPDTGPTFLSQWFNKVYLALAHWFFDGTNIRPPYLTDGGIWAYPAAENSDSEIEAAMVRVHEGTVRDVPFLRSLGGNMMGSMALRIGAAVQIPMEHGNDLNNVTEEGFYWFTISDNAPPGISHAHLWVQKHYYGSDPYVVQVVYGGEGYMALRRNPPADNSSGPGTWGPWQRVSFSSGGGSGGFLSQAVFYSGRTAPNILVLADGTIYNMEDYPDAGVLLGDQYGGDGITTFGVPDLRAEAPHTGGRWMIYIGEDSRSTGRFYCGVGVYCGKEGLYPGAILNL